ncbi:MAG: insulinase family protein [Candidatus Abyssubacteria bacterium]|nr:insulinase family protein [Candidatus Abyssubacteria bacterium]
MPRRYQLSNNIEVITERIPHFKSATIGVWIRAGSVNETRDINGVSHLLEHLFFKGTRTRTARQISEALEGMGGTANAFTSREYTCIYARTLDSHIDVAMELLADVLLNSTFRDVEKEKTVIAEEIQSYIDTPDEHVHDMLCSVIWRRHSLGFPITGSKKGLAALSRKTVKDYYKRWYVPSNVIVAAAGGFNNNALRDLIETHFSGLSGSGNRHAYDAPTIRAAKKIYPRRIGQTHLCIGLPGVRANDKKRYAVNLLANILGGSSISRLYQRVREDEGLAYQVNSFLSSFENTGMIGVYAALGPRQTQKAFDIIIEEMASLKKKKVPNDELQTAKEQLKGSIVLSLESTSGRMMRLARSVCTLGRVENLKTIMNKIDAVTSEEIRELARELFLNEALNVVALGPLKKLQLREL